ncbi:hypothetical protein MXM31_03275 [Klebsiella aerogenes]|uniref:hypothetical protein n=1 Tax=Klebsiella aerogenes TaxID=548 RepID=UPI002D7E988F|nr:hypothetical protein [Klebsiella aerogenes]MEB5695211.1 hypothetical protein [Klebsiella aerogenes]
MKIEIFIEFFLGAQKKQGKESVLKKIHKNLIAKYGSTAVSRANEAKFIVSVEVEEWTLFVFKMINYSQEIGHQWILTGNIEYECSLWTNHSKLVGVDSISITADYIGMIE